MQEENHFNLFQTNGGQFHQLGLSGGDVDVHFVFFQLPVVQLHTSRVQPHVARVRTREEGKDPTNWLKKVETFKSREWHYRGTTVVSRPRDNGFHAIGCLISSLRDPASIKLL